jgi:prolyl oligopeptidase PreP (S9A serine peptidase family)
MEGPIDNYPYLLVTTSTNDDRVHPYHARVFVHRLKSRQAASNRNASASGEVSKVLYSENTEGGHAEAADNAGVAFMNVSSSQVLKCSYRFDECVFSIRRCI